MKKFRALKRDKGPPMTVPKSLAPDCLIKYPALPALRRGAGAVERGGLENRCGCKPTQGSNPCLSANIPN